MSDKAERALKETPAAIEAIQRMAQFILDNDGEEGEVESDLKTALKPLRILQGVEQ